MGHETYKEECLYLINAERGYCADMRRKASDKCLAKNDCPKYKETLVYHPQGYKNASAIHRGR